MANLIETDEWAEGVYQIEETDPVLGGAPNAATGAGMVNIPHLHLARRTTWLKARVDALLATVVATTTAVAGIVQLNASVASTSTTQAATASAVKAANDNANTRALASRAIATAGLATGGGNLTADRTITVPVASAAQAAAGTDNATAMTPLRVFQAIQSAIGAATTAAAGLVQLNASVASTSTTQAATASAVKAANDNANTRALASRAIATAGLATGGGNLTADRTITVPAATAAQAEAGADNATAMTPLRVAQAITAQARTISAGGLATGGGSLAADRTITVPAASSADAQAGADNTKAMTPVRVFQAIRAYLTGMDAASYGTVILGKNLSGGLIVSSALVAGTSLRRASAAGAEGDTPSGTWRAMSYTPPTHVGLFRRIED